jgi:hypothetical protein
MGKIWAVLANGIGEMSGNWKRLSRAAKLAHAKPASKAKRSNQRNKIIREVNERLARGLDVPAAAVEYVQARVAQGQPHGTKHHAARRGTTASKRTERCNEIGASLGSSNHTRKN